MVYFKDLVLGYTFPQYGYVITEENYENYIRAVADNDNTSPPMEENGKKVVPSTMAVLFTFGSYRNFIETPPGGLHARQKYEFLKPLYLGDTLNIQAKVTDKYIKNRRNYVVLETEISRGDEKVVISEMTLIWAR